MNDGSMDLSQVRVLDDGLSRLSEGDLSGAAEIVQSWAPELSGLLESQRVRTALILLTANGEYVDHVLDTHLRRLTAGLQQDRRRTLGATRLPVWDLSALSRGVFARMRTLRRRTLPSRLVQLWQALVPYTDEALGIRDAVRGKVPPGWSSRQADGTHVAEVSNDGLVSLAIALGAVESGMTAESCEGSQHGEALRELLGLSRRILRFYLDEIEDENGLVYMVSRIDDRVEPYNHVHPWAGAAFLIGRLLDDGELEAAGLAFLETFQELTFRDEETGTAWWSYRPPLAGEPLRRGEQIWKAITTLSLPFAVERLEPPLRGYIEREYVPMFMERIFTGRDAITGVPTFQIHIGNAKWRPLERRRIPTESRQNRVESLADWAMLGRYQPPIDNLLFETVMSREDLFPTGWFGSKRATVGLAHILERRPDIAQEYLGQHPSLRAFDATIDGL